MTDLPSDLMSVPARLGASARLEGDELRIDLVRQDATLRLGVLRASVLSFAIDAVAGIVVDQDPESWSFTTDMTVRAAPVAAPEVVTASTTVLREGGRSVTCSVQLRADDGRPVGAGAIGFARVPRRPDDPPKPHLTPQDAPLVFRDLGELAMPLRDEAGVVVVDAAGGHVEMAVEPRLCNPAGTLQGAMVALLAEVAAEELVSERAGSPAVVTDLDLRYLAKATGGRLHTRSTALGDGPTPPVQIELVDEADTVTALVFARAAVPRS